MRNNNFLSKSVRGKGSATAFRARGNRFAAAFFVSLLIFMLAGASLALLFTRGGAGENAGADNVPSETAVGEVAGGQAMGDNDKNAAFSTTFPDLVDSATSPSPMANNSVDTSGISESRSPFSGGIAWITTSDKGATCHRILVVGTINLGDPLCDAILSGRITSFDFTVGYKIHMGSDKSDVQKHWTVAASTVPFTRNSTNFENSSDGDIYHKRDNTGSTPGNNPGSRTDVTEAMPAAKLSTVATNKKFYVAVFGWMWGTSANNIFTSAKAHNMSVSVQGVGISAVTYTTLPVTYTVNMLDANADGAITGGYHGNTMSATNADGSLRALAADFNYGAKSNVITATPEPFNYFNNFTATGNRTIQGAGDASPAATSEYATVTLNLPDSTLPYAVNNSYGTGNVSIDFASFSLSAIGTGSSWDKTGMVLKKVYDGEARAANNTNLLAGFHIVYEFFSGSTSIGTLDYDDGGTLLNSTGTPPINAGTYGLTITIYKNGVSEVKGSSGAKIDYYITPRPVSVYWDSLSLEYSGVIQKPAVSIGAAQNALTADLTNGSLEFDQTGEQKNVVTNKQTKVTLKTTATNNNYYIDEGVILTDDSSSPVPTGDGNANSRTGDSTKFFDIVPKAVTAAWFDDVDLTNGTATGAAFSYSYNGEAQAPDATVAAVGGDIPAFGLNTLSVTVQVSADGSMWTAEQRFAKTYTARAVLSGQDAVNYTVSGTQSFTITPVPLAVTINGGTSKTYDSINNDGGSVALTGVTVADFTGLLVTPDRTRSGGGACVTATDLVFTRVSGADAGTYAISVHFGSANLDNTQNYTLSLAAAQDYTIEKRTLTPAINGALNLTKIYDNTLAVKISEVVAAITKATYAAYLTEGGNAFALQGADDWDAVVAGATFEYTLAVVMGASGSEVRAVIMLIADDGAGKNKNYRWTDADTSVAVTVSTSATITKRDISVELDPSGAGGYFEKTFDGENVLHNAAGTDAELRYLVVGTAPAEDAQLVSSVTYYLDGGAPGTVRTVKLSDPGNPSSAEAYYVVTRDVTVTAKFNQNYNLLTTGDTGEFYVWKKVLSVVNPGGNPADRDYDGTAAIDLTGCGVAVNTADIAGIYDKVALADAVSGKFADKNAAPNKAVLLVNTNLTGADAGNYKVSGATAMTATVNKVGLTLSGGANAVSKTYDGTIEYAESLAGKYTLSGMVFVGGVQEAVVIKSADRAFNSADVASAVRVDLSAVVLAYANEALDPAGDGNYYIAGSDLGGGYTAGVASLDAAITKRALSFTAAATSNITKEYDGTTDAPSALNALDESKIGGYVDAYDWTWATAAGITFDGVLAVTAGAYNSPDVATAATLALNFALKTGMDANYLLGGGAAQTIDVPAVITARAISFAPTNKTITKVYDGTTVPKVSDTQNLYIGSSNIDEFITTASLAAGDTVGAVVTISGVYEYNDKDVANATHVELGLTLLTTNYTLAVAAVDLPASITRRAIEVTVSDGGSKVESTGDPSNLGVLVTDSWLSDIALYDASWIALLQGTNTAGQIRDLLLNFTRAGGEVPTDGSSDPGYLLSVAWTGSESAYTANYTVAIKGNAYFQITPASVTDIKDTNFVTWAISPNIIYSGQNQQSVAGLGIVLTSGTALVSGLYELIEGTHFEVVDFFENKNVGVGSITLKGITHRNGGVIDTTVDNFAGTLTIIFNIERFAVTITPTAGQSKTYGELDPAIAYTSNLTSGMVTGGMDALNGALDRDRSGEGVGDYVVNLGTLLNNINPNYDISLDATAVTFEIIKKEITLKNSATYPIVRTYDGKVAVLGGLAAYEYSFDGLVGGDTVYLSGGYGAGAAATWNDRNAGGGKAVTVTSLALDDVNGAGKNYTLIAGGAGLTGTLNKATLTLANSPDPNFSIEMVYNAGTAFALPSHYYYVLSGLCYNEDASPVLDAVTLQSLNATWWGKGATETASDNSAVKNLDVDGTALVGADAGNYILSSAGGLTGKILRKTIEVENGARAISTTYNGFATFSIDPDQIAFTGIEPGDYAYVNSAVGAEWRGGDINIGTSKDIDILSISLVGADAANYTVNLSPAAGKLTGETKVKQIAIIASAGGVSRVYDGKAAVYGGIADGEYAFDFMDAGWAAGDTIKIKNAGAVWAGGNGAAAGKGIALSSIDLWDGVNDITNYELLPVTQDTFFGAVTPAPLTLINSAISVERDYNALTAFTLLPAEYELSGLLTQEGASAPDTAALLSLAASWDDKNKGTGKVITLSSLALNNGNYYVAAQTLTGEVKVISLRVTAGAAISYEYNGGKGFTIADTQFTLSKMAGDDVDIDVKAIEFADKHAGTGKAAAFVEIGGTVVLKGADSGNYTLSNADVSLVGTITKVSLVVVGGVDPYERDYDSTADIGNLNEAGKQYYQFVRASAGTTVFIDADIASGGLKLSDIAAFNSPNYTANPVLIRENSLTLDGADGGNYVIVSSTLTGKINQAGLTVAGTGFSRVYNGGTAAAITLDVDYTITGRFGSDNLTITGAFADKNVEYDLFGNIVAKNVILTLGGAAANNYTIAVSDVTGTITPLALPVRAGSSVYQRQYDSTAKIESPYPLTAGTYSLVGLLLGDVVTATGGEFISDQAGDGIEIVSVVLSGTDASNYTAAVDGLKGNITRRELNVSNASTPITKQYTNTRDIKISAAQYEFGAGEHIFGDDVTLGEDAILSQRGVGGNLQVSGLTLTGADAANYVIKTNNLLGSITQKVLTIKNTAAVIQKVYDGSKEIIIAHVNYAFDGLLTGDSASLANLEALFDSEDVLSATTVVLKDLSITNGNYLLTAGTLNAKINAARLTVMLTGAPVSKEYDGTDGAANLLAGNYRLVNTAGGVVTTTIATYDASYNSEKVAKANTVTITNATVADTNYYIEDGGHVSGVITQKKLTLAANTTAAAKQPGKPYDGTTLFTALTKDNYSLQGAAAGETPEIEAYSATFNDPNAANANTLLFTGITVKGGNYYVDLTAGDTLTGSIEKLLLTLTLKQNATLEKVYDGNVNLDSLNAVQLNAIFELGGKATLDTTSTLQIVSAKIEFNSPDVTGAYKATVTDAALDPSSANYTILGAQVSGAAVKITPKGVTIEHTGVSVEYSGSRFTLTGYNAIGEIVSGDVVLVSSVAEWNGDGNVSSSKTAHLVSRDLTNPNYEVTAENIGGTVTPKEVTVEAIDGVTITKVYDTTAVIDLTGKIKIVGAVAGETVFTSFDAEFANADAGNGKSITTTSVSTNGNYSYMGTTTGNPLTGNITKAPLNVTVTAAGHVYDAAVHNDVTLTVTWTPLTGIGSEAVTPTFSVAAAKNVGDYALSAASTNYDLTVANATKYAITKRAISAAAVAPIASQIYTSALIEPALTITYGGATLTEGVGADYTLTYDKNVACGTAEVTISGHGNFDGTANATFLITAGDIDKASYVPIADIRYTGDAQTPLATVTLGGATLVKDIDYTAGGYKNNTEVGTAQFTLTGIGNFAGSVKNVTFKIIKRDIEITNVESSVPFGSEKTAITYVVTGGGKTWDGADDVKLTLTFDGASEVPGAVGNYKLRFTIGNTSTFEFAGGASYKEFDFAVILARLTGLSLPSRYFDYDGKAKTLEVTGLGAYGGAAKTITYNGSETAPKNSGSYKVKAVITVPNYDTLTIESTLVINKGILVPEIEERTATTITVKPIDNVLYSIDGENWGPENTFEGLDPSKEYQVFVKAKDGNTNFTNGGGSNVALTPFTPQTPDANNLLYVIIAAGAAVILLMLFLIIMLIKKSRKQNEASDLKEVAAEKVQD